MRLAPIAGYFWRSPPDQDYSEQMFYESRFTAHVADITGGWSFNTKNIKTTCKMT